MATLLGISPGAAGRGGADPWGPPPFIALDPDSLRPGIDLVCVSSYGLPEPKGTWCLYLGHWEGKAACLVAGATDVHMFDPWDLDEPEFLMHPRVNPMEFECGYGVGRNMHAHEKPLAKPIGGKVPVDPFNRGVAVGFRDMERNRLVRPGSAVHYNDEIRRLATKYPGEYGVPILPRARRMMGVWAA